MAQRIRHLTTNQGIPGWSPCKVVIYCLILSCTLYLIFTAIIIYLNSWPCGSMDKASEYESGDSRLESWQGRDILSHTKIDFIPNIYCHYYIPQIRGLVAQCIRHLTTNQGIPGSSPGKVVIYCIILRYTLYLIFTAINAHRKLVALLRNG